MHIPGFFSSTEAKSCEEKVISEPSDFVLMKIIYYLIRDIHGETYTTSQ